ncbi:MAG: hypothetical protein VKM17_04705, partial [Cyanobacteriota bacterium]|nr:hypothetical protein [Cyanobacteriota bacterium]
GVAEAVGHKPPLLQRHLVAHRQPALLPVQVATEEISSAVAASQWTKGTAAIEPAETSLLVSYLSRHRLARVV